MKIFLLWEWYSYLLTSLQWPWHAIWAHLLPWWRSFCFWTGRQPCSSFKMLWWFFTVAHSSGCYTGVMLAAQFITKIFADRWHNKDSRQSFIAAQVTDNIRRHTHWQWLPAYAWSWRTGSWCKPLLSQMSHSWTALEYFRLRAELDQHETICLSLCHHICVWRKHCMLVK